MNEASDNHKYMEELVTVATDVEGAWTTSLWHSEYIEEGSDHVYQASHNVLIDEAIKHHVLITKENE